MSTPQVRVAYADYKFPGFFFPETKTVRIGDYDPDQAHRQAPIEAYAFELFERVEPTPDVGDEFTVIPRSLNRSGVYYLGGSVYKAEELDRFGADFDILRSNARGNGWTHVIKCRHGNWQPFDPDRDKVLDVP